MENFNRQQDKKAFLRFVSAIEQQVSEIGAKRGSNVRSADAVTILLYKTSKGDALKVTAAEIEVAYDAVDKKVQ